MLSRTSRLITAKIHPNPRGPVLVHYCSHCHRLAGSYPGFSIIGWSEIAEDEFCDRRPCREYYLRIRYWLSETVKFMRKNGVV